MTTLIRRSLVLPVLLTAALSVAACSGPVSGTPTPTKNQPTSAPSGTSGNPLAALQPCSLLSQDEMTQLGLGPGKTDNTAKARGCQWAKGTTYTIGIYLDDKDPIESAGSAGVSTVSLQSHDAVQSTSSGFGCGVEIAISKTTSVDVAISNDDCQAAQTYAQLIEPKLPAQQK